MATHFDVLSKEVPSTKPQVGYTQPKSGAAQTVQVRGTCWTEVVAGLADR